MNTIILVPEFKGILDIYYLTAKEYVGKNSTIRIAVDVDNVARTIRLGQTGKVVIFMGAKHQKSRLSALQAYEALKDSKAILRLIDSLPWAIPGAILFSPGHGLECLQQACD